ncbi:unnamed protein product [Vitrella brassicaformis CCMP3155]|uniref:Helitron helicase-like domain-containing protein n=2 Tax=Vitrella brassicaformis TaxID=1169539 RepID=A0A0G4EWK8_VITBC|nr:unnamed protein product [Vitrella brassicaformis CCMP3155]|eukprot:CEM02444.1 unnamed protein product [Vitrella brassicaformis CCMP3155]
MILLNYENHHFDYVRRAMQQQQQPSTTQPAASSRPAVSAKSSVSGKTKRRRQSSTVSRSGRAAKRVKVDERAPNEKPRYLRAEEAEERANALIAAYRQTCLITQRPPISWNWTAQRFHCRITDNPASGELLPKPVCFREKPRPMTEEGLLVAFESIRGKYEEYYASCPGMDSDSEEGAVEMETDVREPDLTRESATRLAQELLREHHKAQGMSRRLCWLSFTRHRFEVHLKPKDPLQLTIVRRFRLVKRHYPESAACDQPLLDPTRAFPALHRLPKRKACPHCDALVWEGDGASFCCQQGKTVLDNLPVPKELQDLVASRYGKQLRDKSLSLNNSFAMTAIGFDGNSDLAASIPHDWGNMTIHGRVYHRILSAEDHPIVGLMFDNAGAKKELDKRVGEMGGRSAREQEIYKYLIDQLKEILHENNPFVRDLHAFGRLAENGRQDIILQFKFKPEADDVCIVLPCSTSAYLPQQRKVFISLKRSGHRGDAMEFVDVLSHVYEPLQYPLLFLKGTPGGNFHLFAESSEIKDMIDRKFYTRAWTDRDILEGHVKR